MDVAFDMMMLDDIEAVMAVEAECFESPWSAYQFIEELAREYSYILLARRLTGGEIAGFICYWVLIDEMHILDIAVRPDYRRSGVGTRLIKEALRRAYGLGALSATLEVRSTNLPAILLYESMGFVRKGIRPGYYDDPPDDAVIMWLVPHQKTP